jgi:galactokinase
MSWWTLNSLCDQDAVKHRLTEAGLTPSVAEEKATLFRKSAVALASGGGSNGSPACAWYVPGRIEVLGKHTDYAGGRSLTAAATQGFCAIALERGDSIVHVVDAVRDQEVKFPIFSGLVPTAGHWSNYPMTVARRVARNFGSARGASIGVASDLPLASGMSSSSAFIVVTLLVLADVNNLQLQTPYVRNIRGTLDLAGYAATIENGQSFGELVGDRGVGTFGGSEDHTAILDSVPGTLGQYSYCPVRKERSVTLPSDLVFAIAYSGVVAEKTGAAMDRYNRASQLASAITEIWRGATGRDDPHLAAVIASAPDAVDRIRHALRGSSHPSFNRDELLARFEHFCAESEQIIPGVADSLFPDTLGRFAELVDRSQCLAESLLGNQVPETSFLAKTAREIGAIAASAFGAGFGGSVWALVEQQRVKEFLDAWGNRYRATFTTPSQNAAFFASRPGPSAIAL